MTLEDGKYIAVPYEDYQHPRLPPYWIAGVKYGAEVRGGKMHLGSENGEVTYRNPEFSDLAFLFSFRKVDNFDEVT